MIQNQPAERKSLQKYIHQVWTTIRSADQKKWLKYTAYGIGTIAFLIISLLVSVRLGLFGKIPSKEVLRQVENPQASIIYSDNDQILGKYFIQNRTDVQYDEISPNIIHALVATEDARFYQHKGVDLRSWIRVFLRTVLLRDRSGGGGSTISQQLAKNLFPRREYALLSIPINKLKEVFTAKAIEKEYTKEEILTFYLNTVPFGGTTFGIRAASRALFDKDPRAINVQEAAVLVGMLKGSTSYNPLNNPDKSVNRRNVVIHQMVKEGYIEASSLDSLQDLSLNLHPVSDIHYAGRATYFREHVRQELGPIIEAYNQEHGTQFNLYTDGLKVYTTIDESIQESAEKAMTQWMKKLQSQLDAHWSGKKPWHTGDIIEDQLERSGYYQSLVQQNRSPEEIDSLLEQSRRMQIFSWEGNQQVEWSPLDSVKYYLGLLQTGILSADPKTGEIKAWVGGIDHQYLKYDHVLSRRQTGSIFKPIVYAKALENDYAPCDYLENQLLTYVDYDDWTPRNADDQYGGLYSLQGALAHSVNTVTVWLALESGIDEVRDLASALGIQSEIPEVPSISLGTVEASLFEMVQVYATIANEGRKLPLYYLKKIEGPNGELIFESEKATTTQVISPVYANVLEHMMTKTVTHGTATALKTTYQIPGMIAAKTGTTQNHTDGWFIGITPNLVTGVWVGGDNPLVRFRSLSLGQGAHMAMPIWALMYKDLYAKPSFSSWAHTKFNDLPYEWRVEMDCEDFIDAPFEPWDEDEPQDLVVDDRTIEKLKRKRSREKRRKQEESGLKAFFNNIFKKKN